MDGREMIHWILLLELSVLMVQAFNTNRPADHQRKILVRMVWPAGHVTYPSDDTTPQPVVIPAATFSRQMVIRFPSSGSIHPDERKSSIASSAGYDPFATEESADYSLDSYVSLSLSSGGSDAEGADQNLRPSNLRNEKSFDADKLDFLQQLLRFAPSAEGDDSSDKCNHPLHSWMCKNKAVVPSSTNPPAVTTTAIRQQPEFFPGSSFENVQILIPDLSPTVVPPLPAPPLLPVQGRVDEAPDSWTGMDPCNHPFHSWMCAKQRPKIIRPAPEFKETGASVVDQNLLLPPLESTTAVPLTTTTPLPVTTKRSGWDGADPCTHPFHSWLCDKRQPAVRITSQHPLPPATTTPQPFIPDASFFIPDINPPAAPPTTTQPPPPPTTSLPLLIRTLAPKKGWDEADSCSHPFHSWLCEKPKIRTTTAPQPTVPPTTTVAPLPPPEEAVVFEPAPSMEEANQLVAEASSPPPTTTTTTTIKPTKSSGWDEADSCSHPFHSWLCVKPPVKIRTTRPPPTTTPPPLPAEVQLPDASNFESLDALPLLLPPQMPTTQKPAVRVAPTEASGWADGADPCTHPFHSWLCNRSPSARQNLKLGPNVRIGRQSGRAVQSESEALDEENLESSRWNTFESLRLPPSDVHPK
ncbi:hypothetical protein GHT06_021329 [Daphnia sinensis]|uniref:Uncharacterized protein n=1 Tax=Daphnia sinensis TaxID=1820382 RepID=A0AAD5PPT3_9CRUS|nr:hypothetical protein GHT06_021329 [Daphnia sinensis]